MFHKILVCSDGSEGALAAARMSAQIAQRFDSAVLLIHPFAGRDWEFAVSREGLDAYAAEARRELEEHTGRIFREAGVKYEALLEYGHPAEAITRVAQQHQTDLIVIGGPTDMPSFLMDSVSEQVLHQAHCPVLIVRADQEPQKAREWQRLLLASDGSEGSCQATVTAVRIAQHFAAVLCVLNVLDASAFSFSLAPCLNANSENPYSRAEKILAAENLLAKITRDVSTAAVEAGVSCSFHQETGYAAETITGFADRDDTDLIVIGCRGQGTFTSLLPGIVSDRVAHLSRHSVLVTR